MSTDSDPKNIQKLQNDVADLKLDVKFLKSFLLKLDEAQEQDKDDAEMQNIEAQLKDA